MENYSHFELTLGGLFIFSTSFLVGCVRSYINTPQKQNESTNEHADGIKAFRATIREISAEKKLLDQGLEDRFKKLEQLYVQKSLSFHFFKSDNKHHNTLLNTQLQELHNNFINSLQNYPDLDISEADQMEYITDLHGQWREHHAKVGVAAATFFNAFDEYLGYLDNSIQKSCTLSIV